MKRPNATASVVILLLAAACAQPAPTIGPASDAEMKAVAAVLATFDSCGRTGALDEFISYSADDVVLLAPDQPAVVGKDAVREVYKSIYAAVTLDMQHKPLETQSLGDLVISRGTASGTATPRAGGPTTAFDNKYLMLFRRQPDGTLKAWRVAFNTNAPPVAPGRAP
ncbi:MAG: nuclear transport factor 2 family protein [Gemmatimonadaceae bacterium]|jgi:ketosteroid isomerase-like protein